MHQSRVALTLPQNVIKQNPGAKGVEIIFELEGAQAADSYVQTVKSHLTRKDTAGATIGTVTLTDVAPVAKVLIYPGVGAGELAKPLPTLFSVVSAALGAGRKVTARAFYYYE